MQFQQFRDTVPLQWFRHVIVPCDDIWVTRMGDQWGNAGYMRLKETLDAEILLLNRKSN